MALRRWTVVALIVAAAVIGTAAFASPLTNAGFETGDLTGWTQNVPSGASATVVSSHTGDLEKTYSPVYGDWFALLKTDGPGSACTISQSVSLTEGQTLSGWAAFDYRDYSPYDDSAWVRVFDGTGSQVAQPWYLGGESVCDYYDGPWTHWSWDAPSAGTYTLEYGVVNDEESYCDSYALFDAEEGAGPEPGDDSPEPATWLLLLATGALGGWARRRRGD